MHFQAASLHSTQPGAQAPQGFKERGKIVCNCFNVAESDIEAALAGAEAADANARVELLKQQLKCGTNCGSCVPELKRMVRAAMPQAQAA